MHPIRPQQKSWRFLIIPFLLLSFIFLMSMRESPDELETPERFFGFQPGEDRKLFDYEQLIQYLQKLDHSSPRLHLQEIGRSPMGKKIYLLFISSMENIDRLEQLKEINRRLALEPNIPGQERKKMLKDGKVFVLATLSMHSSEVGPSQSLPLVAYKLASTHDPAILEWLDNVVYMIVPCHNPDGMDMIVEHYRKYQGTKYEGSPLPGLYHKYVGHDNNRDFIILSQEETKAIAAVYNKEWFPQVMVEKHQMGYVGPRYFVPPPHDPVAENIDAGLWSWVWVFGSNLAKDMTKKGLEGISQHYLFDDYWPGSTETCLWKNVIGFLTECASVQIAKPVFIEPYELAATGKGLSEYKKSINMSLPWPGGWWRLSDIVRYEVESFLSILKTASQNRQEILTFRNDLCRKEVERGQTTPPFYYVLPRQQHDMSELVELVQLLREHGVDVYQLSSAALAGDLTFQEGDIVIPLAQAFRPFIKEVMESQVFPVRHYSPEGQLIRPYDITSWSLPLHWGLKSIEVVHRSRDLESKLIKIDPNLHLKAPLPEKSKAALFSINNNESFKAAFMAHELGMKVERLEEPIHYHQETFPLGSFIISIRKKDRSRMKKLLEDLKVAPAFLSEPPQAPTKSWKIPRIALVESYFHDMDAGWTRFILDRFHIPYHVLRPGDFEKGTFVKDFDVILFPDQDDSILKTGKRKSGDLYIVSGYPPEFTKGIGDKGMEKLMTFVHKGGIIISWGRSAKLFMGTLTRPLGNDRKEEFQLPMKDLSKKVRDAGFYCPGSLLRVNLIEGHPLTLGMEKEAGVFYTGSLVFSTSIPQLDMDRRVIASFPEKGILLSGYIEHEEQIGNKAAMVWFQKGQGQIVLFSFHPQFRGSTHGTLKLIFNSILLNNFSYHIPSIERSPALKN